MLRIIGPEVLVRAARVLLEADVTSFSWRQLIHLKVKPPVPHLPRRDTVGPPRRPTQA